MGKIVDYPALTTPADTDVLVIEDLAAGSTKKITRADFLRYGTAYSDQMGGWYAGTGTWTYGSATTITVPSADAAVMSAGTKLRLTQTTTKYFYVVSKSGTTITVTGGTDYSVANAAITSPYLSNAASPTGFPQWFAYVPTWTSSGTNPTLGNGTLQGYFSMTGKTVSVRVNLVLGSTTSTAGATGFSFLLPVTASSSVALGTPVGTWYGENPGVLGYLGQHRLITTTTVGLVHHSATAGAATTTSATAPATWSNTWFIRLSGHYEAA